MTRPLRSLSTGGRPTRPDQRTAGATRTGRRATALVTVVVSALALVLLAGASSARAGTTTVELSVDQRVYDRTGASLTSDEAAELRRLLDGLVVGEGADGIVLVRALDATPTETLDQVEQLQQRWVAATGVDEDVAFAILINRNPRDDTDARAGIYVGATFDDGNVPPSEQVAIVEEALIPPLREGDVHRSLVDALDRLGSSIRTGPPTSAFDEWASAASRTWLPWVLVGVAAIGLAAARTLHRRRQTTDAVLPAPTTVRPGWLEPAVAGALVAAGPRPSAVSAMILDLAGRGALAIEAEDDGGMLSSPSVRVRLLDPGPVRGPVETVLWEQLEQRTGDEPGSRTVVGSQLRRLASSHRAVDEAIRRRLGVEGWLDEGAPAPRAGLVVIGVLAVVLAAAGAVVAATGGNALPVVGLVGLAGLAVAAFVMAGSYSPLSTAGQEQSLRWRSYRDGLAAVAAEDPADLDLDVTLPDLVAFDLGGAVGERLEDLGDDGRLPRVFAAGDQPVSSFPWWVAYTSATSPMGGSTGAGTVAGGGAGGGGGAAGST